MQQYDRLKVQHNRSTSSISILTVSLIRGTSNWPRSADRRCRWPGCWRHRDRSTDTELNQIAGSHAVLTPVHLNHGTL